MAEYRKPEFGVTIAADEAETLRGEARTVTVKAEFFFGGSATDLPIQYVVYQKPFQLDPPVGLYYSFSDEVDYVYRGGFFQEDNSGYFGEPVTSGEGMTNGDGEFVLTLPASLLDAIEAGSVEVTVEANVLDLGNFPVAATTSIVYHGSEIYAGITPAQYVGSVGDPMTVDVVTLDWVGERVPNAPIEVVFYQREWEYQRVEQFGQYTSQWTPIDTEVSRSAGTTNENGEVQATFTPDIGGSYVAKATTTDSGGRTHTSNTFFWIADPNYAGWRVDPKEKRMDLTLGKEEYNVGDTASILVQSPFEGPVQAWLQIERGRLIEQRLITLQTGSDVIELPILPEYAPNVHVTIVAVKGIDDSNPYADIRLGLVEINVSTEQLTLNVELTPRQDLLQPGETVTFDVLVTDYA
ncbi:MAG: hypothetical protein KAG66_12800, partial [Methylococcales bacterium]|nr:hypothetical protein [Methylococcales bacterium]